MGLNRVPNSIPPQRNLAIVHIDLLYPIEIHITRVCHSSIYIPSTISVCIMNTAEHCNILEKSYLDIKARVASLFQEKCKYMLTFWESTQSRGGGVSKRLKWKSLERAESDTEEVVLTVLGGGGC